MKLIGLTGGIGSGKSTVSALLAQRGAVVVDADAIVRELQAPGQPVYEAIVERFGSAVVAADGTLDRPTIAGLVFPDAEALADLNRLTHPAVATEITRRIAAHVGTDAVVVLDVPLLVESSNYEVDGILVVDCPVEVAVERLVTHRGMDEDDARARISRQASREDRLARADFVVDNSGSLGDVAAQVEAAWVWIEAIPDRPT